MEVGGPYRVRQSMSSHGEHRLYDFADPSMLRLSSPALIYIYMYTLVLGLERSPNLATKTRVNIEFYSRIDEIVRRAI